VVGVAVLQDFKEYHTDTTVHFVITLSPENMAAAEAEGLEKRFKLTTTLSTSNMVCFDAEGRIRRYSSPEEILREFFPLRLEFYQKRKVCGHAVLNELIVCTDGGPVP
jgi:DNA topoisomerase II